MRVNATYRELRRKRLCIDCGNPVGSARCRCPDCAKADREKMAKLRREAVKAGLCSLCRKRPLIPDTIRCGVCQKRRRGRPHIGRNVTIQRRQRAGACPGCNGSKPGDRFARCADCRKIAADKTKARTDAKIAAGRCGAGGCNRKLPATFTPKRRDQPRPRRCGWCNRKRREATK